MRVVAHTLQIAQWGCLDCAARLEETPAPSTPALTLEQVQALSARVAAVVSERDRLREEVKCLRLMMAELGNLH